MIFPDVGNDGVFLVIAFPTPSNRAVVDKKAQMLGSEVLPAGPIITTFFLTLTAVPQVFGFSSLPVGALPFTNVSVKFVLFKII